MVALSAIEGLLCLGLVYSVAAAFDIFPSADDQFSDPLKLTTAYSGERKTLALDPQVLRHFDPFQTGPALVTTIAQAAGVPETDLDLTLLGVRQTLGAAKHGSAIIRLPNKVERVFAVGDEIIKGTTLRAVFTSHVEISRRNNAETLYLLGTEALKVGSNRRVTVSNAQAIAGAGTLHPSDLKTFAAETSLAPRKEGRKITGWIIKGADVPDVLSVLGLQKGDILTSINDVKLRRAETFAELAEEIGSVQRLVIRLERDSKPVELTFGYKVS